MDYNTSNTSVPLQLVTPSENPIWYTAEGLPTGTPLSYGKTIIESVAGTYVFANGDFIKFVDNWGNNVTFTWVDNPSWQQVFSSSSRYVIGGSNPLLYNVYLQSFIDAFNASILSAHFIARLDTSVSPSRIVIDNLIIGSGGSLLSIGGTFPTLTGGSTYLVSFVFGAVPYQPMSNYQSPYTIAQVLTNAEEAFPSTATYGAEELVGELIKAFPTDGGVLYFDPSGVLRNIVETSLPQIDVGFKQLNQLKRYWINYGTGGHYGINSNQSFNGDVTQIRWVLNAAQPLEYDSNLTPYWKNALNPCNGDIVKCLTNEPNKGIARKPVVYSKTPLLLNEREFLSFICEISGASVEVYYEARYDGGISLSGSITVEASTGVPLVSQIGVLTIDVSPDLLGFGALPDEIRDYNVQIFVGGVEYTEKRLYYVINNCLPSRTQVMFLNRLGGWDTYYFIGDNNTKDSRKAQEFNKTPSTNIKTYNRGTAQFNINYTRGLSLSSGQLNNTEFIWLEELLGSNDVYIINNKREFEAVTVTSFDRNFSSREQLYTIDIVIEKSLPTNNINNTGISSTLPFVPPFLP